MSRPLVIGLGELLWDVFGATRKAGGAPANVAYHAGQLGMQGAPASRVGNDEPGQGLLEFLEQRGLSTKLVQRDHQHPTGVVTVSVGDRGQPSYIIHENSAWDHLQPTESLLSACGGAEAVCFGTLAQRTPDSRETIHQCLHACGDNTLVVYDVNLRQMWYARDWIEKSIAAADVVKLNDEELVVLAPLLDLPDAKGPTFSRSLHERGVRVVVITRGAAGCSVYSEGNAVDIASRPVSVVDTVGAGDAFTAAFITGMLKRWPLPRCGRLANAVGGLVAAREGAMPDVRAEVAKLVTAAEQEQM
ncbi:MAG: carbohydrate kinase family protein [Planctomycetaceae bacterium]